MKEIVIPPYKNVTDNFDVIVCPGFTLKIEHSLDSISKWESKYKKPYLEQKEFTYDEFVYYIDCMILNRSEIPEDWVSMLTVDSAKEIQEYIEDYPSATIIKHGKDKNDAGKRFITSELIYAYMAMSRVPFSADKWNIRRLLNLLEIIAIEQTPKKKVPKSQTLDRYRAMNKARRKPR